MAKSLRIVSSNLWHGLDHTKPHVMFPVENPFEMFRRTAAMYRGFAELRHPNPGPSHLEIFCIQEGNPVRKVARRLARHLSMFQALAEANVGVRVGAASYPLFLQEGLITLWNGALKASESARVVLSNPIPEMDFKVSRFSLPVSLQLAERRVALLVTGTWEGQRIGVANLHVHHGPPESTHNRRRLAEFGVLIETIQPELASCDHFIIAGDFNCEKHHDEYRLLADLGFVELSLGGGGEPIITWEPDRNPVCRRNVSLNDPSDPAAAWDAATHQFDHILMRSKAHPGQLPDELAVSARRIFDSDALGAWVSDHYGLCVDVTWKTP